MNRFARLSLVLTALAFAAPALAQQPAPGWSYPQLTATPAPVAEPLPPAAAAPLAVVPPNAFPAYLPERPVAADELPPPPRENGQQHWVSLNLSVFQPFVGRIGVKVLPRANDSVWLEAYAGSVLFERMYGFGVRVQHTAFTFGSGGRVMVGPGVGVHILPTWRYFSEPGGYGYYGRSEGRNSLAFVAADVDISWLHDFSPHFGFEVGMKLGLAGRVAGEIGRNYPSGVMFGRNLYPIFALYSGFRF